MLTDASEHFARSTPGVGAPGALGRRKRAAAFALPPCASGLARLALEPPVTIVLPLHNAERMLRPTILRILELGAAPQRRLTVAIVDDGSTDETYETACELARDYPQVCVFRQPIRRGLGPALEMVRQGLNVTEAIVHDGAGPIDLEELCAMLRAPQQQVEQAAEPSAAPSRGSRRFAAVSALNARMVEAHRAISSFHWLKLPESERPRRRAAVATGDASPRVVPLANLPNVGLIDVSLPLY
jgi:hypothetical protein